MDLSESLKCKLHFAVNYLVETLSKSRDSSRFPKVDLAPEERYVYRARSLSKTPFAPEERSYHVPSQSIGINISLLMERRNTLVSWCYKHVAPPERRRRTTPLGKEKEAWRFYDRYYKLEDKEEIRRRVIAILHRQPVYKFIYNHAGYK